MKRFLSLLLGFLLITTGVHAQDSDVGTPPERVWLENPDIVITNISGGWELLGLQFSPENENVNNEMTWTFSNEGIVDISCFDGEYRIKALSFGSTSFTGTTVNGLTVEGTATVEGIIFDEYNLNMTIGESIPLTISTSSDEIYDAIEWRVAYPEVASVSQNGVVTALSAGETMIQATASVNGRYYWRHVSVIVHPEAGTIALSRENVSLQVGDVSGFVVLFPEGEDIINGSWGCSVENIIRFEDSDEATSCRIVGVSNGTTTVTYTAENGLTASCTVNVYTNINDYSLNAEQASLIPGGTFQIEITTDPENAGQTFSYSSSNEEIATVDANGLVTAVGYGETAIQVYPEQQRWLTRWLTVNVAQMPESIELENTNIDITQLDLAYELNITFTPDNDEVNKVIEWTASDDNIIDFGDWGSGRYYVVGRNFGTASFTGTTPNGLTIEGNVSVNGIKMGNRNLYLSIGESQSLDVTTSSNEIRNALTLGVDNPEIASVSEDGTVTALSVGETVIYANAWVDGKQYYTNAWVYVLPEPGTVALNTTHITILSEDWNYVRVLFPEGEENYDGTWSIADESIARLGDIWPTECQVIGVAPGTTTLTYTAANGATASCEVTVYNRLNDYSLNAYETTLAPNQTFQIEIVYADPENHGQNFVYRSADKNIATVDENGLVTAVNYGETTITVAPEQQSWYERTLRVYVKQLPEDFEILNPEMTINAVDVEMRIDLAFTPDNDEVNKDLIWESSDPNVATIVRYGNEYYYRTGNNFGTANITLTTPNGLTQEAVVNVRGIKIANRDGREMYLLPGESVQLTAEASSPELLNGAYWESYNPEVVSIDENGFATAHKYGNAEIRIINNVDDVYYADWVIMNVRPESGTIALSEETMSMRVGDTSSLTVYYAQGEQYGWGTWTSSNEDVVSINYNWYDGCNFTANIPGEAIITYTSEYGVTASCDVTVSSNIESISLTTDKSIADLKPGESFQIIATTYPEDPNAQFGYWVENSGVATVDNNGLVYINAYGETNIHVYLADNSDIDATLNVKVEVMPANIVIENNEIEVTNTSSSETIPLDVILDFPDDVVADEDYINDEIVWTCEPEGIVEVETKTYEVYDPVRNPMRKLSPRVTKERYVIKPTGRELGDVTVTGTTANGLTATAKVSVTGIAFSSGDMYLTIGENSFIDVKTIPEELAGMITYTVGDNYVADIDNGIVVAKAAGYTTVYATAVYNGTTYSGSFNVTVNLKQPTGITALKESINLSVGQTVTYAAKELFEVQPTEDVDDHLSLYYSGSEAFSMSEEYIDGKQYVTFDALNEGEGYICAYTSNEIPSVEIPVYVTDEPLEITLNEEDVVIFFLDQKQLTATVTPADREVDITWESSNSWAVTVDTNGRIMGVGPGAAVITATATDKNGSSVSASCNVYVIFFSSVEEILQDGETCDVFTVDGIVLKKNATTEDLKSLTEGVYVIKKGNDTFKIKI